MKKINYLVALLLFLSNSLSAQVINAYARVTAISGTTLTLASVNESAHTFNVGEKAILIQMQDDVIGSNTADDASFGDLASIGSAGNYEVVTITNKSLPTIQVNAISNTYNTCVNCRVQLVSFRRLGAPHYTTTGNITGLAWNGDIGGIVALEVPGTLTLNHNITADGIGFRGGATSIDYYDGSTSCYATPYRANDNRHGFKGEGIYRNTLTTYNNARAKILNGGGGGNHINAGGGGGGNFTAGGRGGPGWNSTFDGCPVSTGGYGYGGISLSSVITEKRIFMGGGGGGGQQNNTAATAGGNGGGIIFIKANQIVTTGCPSRVISANGLNASNTVGSGIDGAGGAGAGGTIILQVENYTLSSSCPLIIRANGGNGGTVNSSTHGGGGAGGQGAIFASVPAQPANSIFQTLNGQAGCNNNSNPCNNFAGSASGTNNMGIFFLGYGTPLPVLNLHFKAYYLNESQPFVNLAWQNDNLNHKGKFKILKSYNDETWFTFAENILTDNDNQIATYERIDTELGGELIYYQLVMEDWNGKTLHTETQSVWITETQKVYPNPFHNEFTVEGIELNSEVIVFNELGQVVYESKAITPKWVIPAYDWRDGLYIVKIVSPSGSIKVQKMLRRE